jgi:HK97 family phage prohead protease
MEKRFLSPLCHGIELRFADPGDDVRVDASAADGVVGYAAKFEVRSEDMGFVEVIARGAFDDVLGDDVVALFNHDPNQPLARTIAGTLRLSVDDVGLRYEFDLADDECSKRVAAFINDGRVNASSFAFTVAIDGDRWEREADGTIKRTILKVGRLYDVSPVTYPAYPDATVALRAEVASNGMAALAAFEAAEKAAVEARARRRARELELARLG